MFSADVSSLASDSHTCSLLLLIQASGHPGEGVQTPEWGPGCVALSKYSAGAETLHFFPPGGASWAGAGFPVNPSRGWHPVLGAPGTGQEGDGHSGAGTGWLFPAPLCLSGPEASSASSPRICGPCAHGRLPLPLGLPHGVVARAPGCGVASKAISTHAISARDQTQACVSPARPKRRGPDPTSCWESCSPSDRPAHVCQGSFCTPRSDCGV